MERLNGKAPAAALDFGHTSFRPVDQNNPGAYETGNQLPPPPAQEDPMDPKKLKRIMASRQYSQRYRMKQMQYILHLETEAKALQAQVEIASPRIKYVGQQNSLLRAENRSMRNRLATYMGELIFKEAQHQELKKERENLLKCLYYFYQTNDFVRNGDGRFPSLEEDGNQQR